MVDNAAHNPFAPGSGQLPPYLGGREDQQQALRRMLSYVEAGRTTPRDVVLIGPRGNGKTVLLRWFETTIGDESPDVDVVWLTPSAIRNLNDLATELAPRTVFAGCFLRSCRCPPASASWVGRLATNPGLWSDCSWRAAGRGRSWSCWTKRTR